MPVKIFGMPPSQNVAGSVMLAMEAKVGGMEMCNIMEGAQMKPDFLAMNPFHHIPALKDGDVTIGESGAILRYLALKYKPELYPTNDLPACANIDFALDSFNNEVKQLHFDSPYVVMGFKAPPANQKDANDKYVAATTTWCSHFLSKGKFVNGDQPSIADYNAVPFFYAAVQPAMKAKIGLVMPDRVVTYCADFQAAVASSSFMMDAGGYSIKEFIASKA
jgi:glutathione S-transferase